MSKSSLPELTIQRNLFGGLTIRVGFSRVDIPEELLPQFFTDVRFYAGTSWTPVTDQVPAGGNSVTSAQGGIDEQA